MARAGASVRRRRIAVITVAILATIGGAGYAWSYWAVGTPRYERIPAAVWKSHNPAAIGRMRILLHLQDSVKHLPTLAAARTLDPLPPPSVGLTSAAEKWISAVDLLSPQTILWGEPDARGNLYVVFGVWYSELRADDQVIALNSYGVAWRKWLAQVAGEWDTTGHFAPGIIVLDTQSDTKGPVATNINGSIKIFRQPEY